MQNIVKKILAVMLRHSSVVRVEEQDIIRLPIIPGEMLALLRMRPSSESLSICSVVLALAYETEHTEDYLFNPKELFESLLYFLEHQMHMLEDIILLYALDLAIVSGI